MSSLSPRVKALGSLIVLSVICLSFASVIQIHRISLPFSSSFPIINIIVSLFTLAALWSLNTQNSHVVQWPRFGILLGFITHLIPVILAVGAISHVVPSNFRACIAEKQWSKWFRAKDEAVIRSIQDTLHCCGLNSVLDRAWPFPSQGVDAHACEQISGTSAYCGPLWETELLTAASLSVAGSFIAEIVVLFTIYHLGMMFRPQMYYHPVSPDDDAERGRIEYRDDVAATIREEEQRRLERGHGRQQESRFQPLP